MAYDKVVDSAFLEAGLKKVGDSIRAKAGTSELLEFPDAMSAAVDAIDTSKPEQTKTATPSLSQQTIVPDSGKTLSGVTVGPITSTLLTSLDPDFKPENIAKDANLFGLVGTHAGGGDTATLTVNSMGGMVELIDSDGVYRVVDIWQTGNFTVAVPTIVCAHDGFNSYAEGSVTTLAAAATVGVFLVTGDATIYGEGDLPL